MFENCWIKIFLKLQFHISCQAHNLFCTSPRNPNRVPILHQKFQKSNVVVRLEDFTSFVIKEVHSSTWISFYPAVSVNRFHQQLIVAAEDSETPLTGQMSCTSFISKHTLLFLLDHHPKEVCSILEAVRSILRRGGQNGKGLGREVVGQIVMALDTSISPSRAGQPYAWLPGFAPMTQLAWI